ncbi:MAG: UPF0175 family protein [Bacteroidia bacterium]
MSWKCCGSKRLFAKKRILIENKYMRSIIIPVDIPSDVFVLLNESEQELKLHFQLALAIKLFQDRKLTMGKAIQLSGLSRFEFEKALAKSRISVSDLDTLQIFSDVDKLKDL